MKMYLGVALGVIAGMAVGGFAVEGLHAQGKAPVYFISEVDVTDPEAFGNEFAPKAQATIRAAAGGKLLFIGGVGGAGAKPISAMKGTPPKRAVVQQWESMEALNKWYHSAEYQELLNIGQKYATFRHFAVEGQ
jgi:uncharacterized protein (DUF1330 family)